MANKKHNKKKARSRRDREWPSDDPSSWYRDPEAHEGPPATTEELIRWLKLYTADLAAWGQDVRDDIIRLEAACGIARGDPGDPPGGPPE